MAEPATEAVLGRTAFQVDHPSEEQGDPSEGPGCEKFTTGQHQPCANQGQSRNKSHPSDDEPVEDATGMILRHQHRLGLIPSHSTRTPNGQRLRCAPRSFVVRPQCSPRRLQARVRSRHSASRVRAQACFCASKQAEHRPLRDSALRAKVTAPSRPRSAQRAAPLRPSPPPRSSRRA